MFSITHYSIREVVRAAEKHKQYALMGDALSLAREQVEKVFIIAALLDDPNRAFKQFLRSSWKNEYEKFCWKVRSTRKMFALQNSCRVQLPRVLSECGAT